jgi:16S rRNA U516 pseudouridylate synthase RsuA-like enzyme
VRWLEEGVDLGEDEWSSPAKVEPAGRNAIDLVIAEGKKRQVRRMCKAVGLWLVALQRVAFGPAHARDLPPGKTRPCARTSCARSARPAADPGGGMRGKRGRPVSLTPCKSSR